MTSFKIISCSALLALAPIVAHAAGTEVLSTQAAGAGVAGAGGAGGAGAAAGAGAGAAAAAGIGVGTLTTVAVVGAVAVAAGIASVVASAITDDGPSGTPATN